ncbi:MAG: aspartate dehydrogenase [Candidatus Omnitrophota bacterium]|nr:aspartate dehydrogenase [Candidatus Omnitrophota bacterium]
MNSKRLKIGIIGCGTIGREIARACQDKLYDKVDLVALCDIDEKKAAILMGLLKKVSVLKLDELIKKAGLVVEAASANICADIVRRCIKGKKDCMVMSVGGLIGNEKLLKAAGAKGVKIYIPSGAICGLDGLKAAAIGKIDAVTLTTRKPPKGLAGAPYLTARGIDVFSVNEETVIFEGNVTEAVKGFPQNINVSAVLSLAGIGAGKTRVKIVTSPDYTANIHELEITGECGRIKTSTDNVPSHANPKTSRLAIMSAIATLESIVSAVRIGT